MDTESPPPPYSHQECLREEVAVLRVALALMCDKLERNGKRWDQWMEVTNQANSIRHAIYKANEEEWQKWRKSVVAVTVQQDSPVETSRVSPKRAWSFLPQRLYGHSLVMSCTSTAGLILALMHRNIETMLIISVVYLIYTTAIVVLGMSRME